MATDVSALDALPAETTGLLPCGPVTCEDTCVVTCSGCFTNYTRDGV
jgi:hypothetical protein